jgi:hypothetical protein
LLERIGPALDQQPHERFGLRMRRNLRRRSFAFADRSGDCREGILAVGHGYVSNFRAAQLGTPCSSASACCTARNIGSSGARGSARRKRAHACASAARSALSQRFASFLKEGRLLSQ